MTEDMWPCLICSGAWIAPLLGAILGHGKIWNLTWKKYAHPLPRVYAIFLFAIEYSAKAQPPQHTTTGARAPGVPPSPPPPTRQGVGARGPGGRGAGG